MKIIASSNIHNYFAKSRVAIQRNKLNIPGNSSDMKIPFQVSIRNGHIASPDDNSEMPMNQYNCAPHVEKNKLPNIP